MEQVQRTCEQLRAEGFSGKHRGSLMLLWRQLCCCADIDVVECIQRPYEVKPHTLVVPSVGVVSASGGGAGRKVVRPSLGSASLLTAQATNRIPGHTGYLITATLHCKTNAEN